MAESIQRAAGDFTHESVRYLRDVYVPRLARALDSLPAGDLWWTPHAGVLSFGVVLRHLEGNVRQWILSGVGGVADLRDRASEFAEPGAADGAALLAALESTVGEAARVIEGLGVEQLAETRVFQGEEHTILQALYHVVEHFSWHTGQAVWIAKARAGAEHGVRFYDDARINAARNE